MHEEESSWVDWLLYRYSASRSFTCKSRSFRMLGTNSSQMGCLAWPTMDQSRPIAAVDCRYQRPSPVELLERRESEAEVTAQKTKKHRWNSNNSRRQSIIAFGFLVFGFWFLSLCSSLSVSLHYIFYNSINIHTVSSYIRKLAAHKSDEINGLSWECKRNVLEGT